MVIYKRRDSNYNPIKHFHGKSDKQVLVLSFPLKIYTYLASVVEKLRIVLCFITLWEGQ